MPLVARAVGDPPERGDEELDCVVVEADEQRGAAAGQVAGLYPLCISASARMSWRVKILTGAASVETLGNDGYTQMIKDRLHRPADRLA